MQLQSIGMGWCDASIAQAILLLLFAAGVLKHLNDIFESLVHKLEFYFSVCYCQAALKGMLLLKCTELTSCLLGELDLNMSGHNG